MIAIGQIVSFGTVTFEQYSSTRIKYDLSIQPQLDAVPGSPYPVNKYGLSPTPLNQPQIEADLAFIGNRTYNPAITNPTLDMQTKINQLANFYLTVNGDGTCGQVDTLTVLDADGVTHRTCQALLVQMPVEVRTGTNWRFTVISCIWVMLSPLV